MSIAQNSISSENRAQRRTRTLKKARIVEPQTLTTTNCVIRDGTDQGYRLKLQTQFRVPDEFKLINDTDETSSQCSVIWRQGNEMGVRFHGA